MLLQQDAHSLIVSAPAKLNLHLEILSKRPDGYHELETLMVSVGIYDSLCFTQEGSDRIRLRCFDAGARRLRGEGAATTLPSGPTNLVVRAAQLLRNYAGVSQGVCIDLHKRIPVAAGLAGGSSDAAATLWGLNRFWNLNLSQGELESLASQLGSDINFFFAGTSAAICRGRGEIVEPLSFPLDLHFVIAVPSSGLSTPLVYQRCRPASRPQNAQPLVDCLKAGRLGQISRLLHNALQPTAERLNDDVVMLKARFSDQPVLGHLMSGSGTAYFGVCANRRHALAIAARLNAMRTGRVFVAQSGP